MEGNHRPIFRADAVRRYIQSQQRAVLPRLICPSTFLYLWILLGLLLLAASLVTWLARGPLFVGEANARPGMLSGLQRPSPLWRPPISQPAEDCG
jgi:hypothetical protein